MPAPRASMTGAKNVVEFGAAAAKVAAKTARTRFYQDPTTVFPTMRGSINAYDLDTVWNLTRASEAEQTRITTMTAPTEMLYNIARRGEPGDAEYLAELEKGSSELANLESALTEPVRVAGRFNPETGDLDMFVDPNSLSSVEMMRLAQMKNPDLAGDLPVEVYMDEAPSNYFADGNWKHSGTINWYSAPGGKISADAELVQSARIEEFNFPFLKDINARVDPELRGKWWTDNKLSIALYSPNTTAKYQPMTVRESEEIVATSFDTEVADLSHIMGRLFDYETTGNGSPVGAWIQYHLLENGIDPDSLGFTQPLRFANQNHTDSELLKKLLDGKLVPGFSWRTVMEENEQVARELQGFQGSAFNIQNKNRVTIDNYFSDTVFGNMRQGNPGRYRQFEKFMEGSPYVRGVIYKDGKRAREPVPLFHGENFLNAEEWGLMSASLHPGSRELGMHSGDLRQAGLFSGSDVTVTRVPSAGISSEVPTAQMDFLWSSRKRELEMVLNRARQRAANPDNIDTIYGVIADTVSGEGRLLIQPNTNERTIKPSVSMITDRVRARLNRLGIPAEDIPKPEVLNRMVDLERVSSGQMVYPFAFRGKRPFRLYDSGSFAPEDVAGQMLKYGPIAADSKVAEDLGAIYYKRWPHQEATKYIRNILRDFGFDHILYINKAEGPGRPSIIVLNQDDIMPLYATAPNPKDGSPVNAVAGGVPIGMIAIEGEEANGN